MNDADFMARALHLAENALYTTDPNPRVGCVLVKNNVIIGEGWHRKAGGPHAEIEALRMAGPAACGATAYVTLEPCSHHGRTPPCSTALIEAGIRRVFAAMQDPNPRVAGSGLRQLEAAGIPTHCGLLASAAEALNPGFCQRMRTGRPFIRSKLAMSLDGRTAMASGESQWITGIHARRDVHRLRARSSAIVTGIGTVLADNPTLTARLDAPAGDVLQPVRIVLDPRLRMPDGLHLAQAPGSILLTTLPESHWKPLSGIRHHELPDDGQGRLNLTAVVDWLGKQHFNEVLFEAGPILNGALLQENLVDEWIIYMAPIVMGDRGRGLFHLPALERMADRHSLRLVDIRHVGQDMRMTLTRNA